MLNDLPPKTIQQETTSASVFFRPKVKITSNYAVVKVDGATPLPSSVAICFRGHDQPMLNTHVIRISLFQGEMTIDPSLQYFRPF